MSIIDTGREKQEQYEKREQELLQHRTNENEQATIARFYTDFYRDHYKYDQNKRKHVAENLPVVENWQTSEYGNSHGDSSFDCEGLHYRVHWRFMGRGGDLAHWDDGYWPDWYLKVKKPMKLFPFIKRTVWVDVHGPESIARALEA